MNRRPLKLLLLLWLALPGASSVSAADPAAAEAATDHGATLLKTVLVTGTQPGPGLWQVSKDGHVLWLLGNVSPVPKKMRWNASEVEQIIARSGAVLAPPAFVFDADVGFFKMLFLLPKLLKARNSPEHLPLAKLVNAGDYARWLVLKQRYLGKNTKVESYRPIFAAQTLYDDAIARVGLSNRSVANKVIRKATSKRQLKATPTLVKIKIEDSKALLKDFNATTLNDTECFSKILTHLDADLETMADRANAWATGDLEMLRALPYTDPSRVCMDAVFNDGIFMKRGIGMEAVRAQAKATWLAAAEAAIKQYPTSFGSLPMAQILKADGYVAALRDRGYTVTAPDAEAAATSSAP